MVETRRVAPRPRAPKTQPKNRLVLRLGAPVLRLARAYPGRSAAAVGLTLMMGMIVGNATLMQHGRHPAPLFAGAAVPPPPETKRASQPLEAPAQGPTVPTGAGGPSGAAATPRLAVGSEEPVRRRIRNPSSVATDDTPTGVAAPKTPDPEVLRAQHALVKLGFDIKPDGQLGSGTRKALDSFASTHHIPVMQGTISAKLLQALTAAASKPQG